MIADQDVEQMVETCRCTTSPSEEERVLTDARAAMTERSTRAANRAVTTKTPLRLAVAASLALLLLMGVFLSENPQTVVWADVQKKVTEQKWIHISGKSNDGETFESWLSNPLKIDATKSGNSVTFNDNNRGILERYDAEDETITRSVDLSARNQQNFQAMADLFKSLLSGAESVKLSFPGVEIVSQTNRRIKRDGKDWIEFELQARERGDTESQRIIFLIEPDSHLIRSMQVVNGEQEMTATISYPKTGPKSIYDLGVPKSAKVIDLTPSTDVAAIIKGVETSLNEFGPYIAVNVIQDADAPWYVGTPSKVWADGAKMRMEYGIVDPNHDAFQKPERRADQKQWWFQHWDELWHYVTEVMDGQMMYVNQSLPANWSQAVKPHPITWDPADFPKPKWNASRMPSRPVNYPIYFAYRVDSSLGADPSMTAELNTSPEEGPEGTVLLTLTRKDPNSPSMQRFWIDPKRSHIVIKSELIQGPLPGTSRYTILVKELAKSPRGIWYPTLVSHKSVNEQDGKMVEQETITRHYFDFEGEFPKGVFEPKLLPESK